MLETEIDAFVDDVLAEAEAPEPIWSPFPNTPQEAAYHCLADIIGYGGAGGGGKTDLMLGKAYTQFYNAMLFRREYPQLDGIIARGDEIQNGRCQYVAGDKKRWMTPEGRSIKLGSIEHEADVTKYKGRARDFIAFDEAADFSEFMVRFVIGWLRTNREDIHPQVLLTFNPPTTPEGEWIVKFFAPWIDASYQGKKAKDGELRWYIRYKDEDVEVESGEPVVIEGEPKPFYPTSRTFFSARVEDNPVYMATGYDKHLESLPEPLRSQLRYGDFAVSVQDDIWQAIPTAWIIEAQNRSLTIPKPDVALRTVGCDPSRGGRDETTIAKLYGVWFDELIIHQGKDVPDGAVGARYITDAMKGEDAPVFIDVIGIGSSVYDHLKILGGMKVTPVNVGSGSDAKDKTGRYTFFNLRSQIIWQFREALDPASGQNVVLPLDTQLRQDLRSARFQIVSGKIKIEEKKDIKTRIGRSPDRGDVVVMTWYGAEHSRRHRSGVW